MNPSRRELERWLHRDHRGAALPSHLLEEYERMEAAEREHVERIAAIQRNALHAYVFDTGATLDRALEELQPKLNGHAERRRQEDAVADYLDFTVQHHNGFDFTRTVNRLRACRRCAYIYYRDLQPAIAWDQKCGDVHLCPDEAREEQARLINRYVEYMAQWTATGVMRRAFYAVLTLPNAEPGELRAAKVRAFAEFDRWRKKFKGLHGALVCQEDPLSAADSWNVHLNVILLWQGPCNWDQLRAAWGHWMHIQLLHPAGLADTLRELVKYSAKLVRQEQPDREPGADDGEAPPMIEWPPARMVEWYKAQLGSRRVRSYGVLYAIERRRWDGAQQSQRYEWIKLARERGGLLELFPISMEWLEIPEPDRVLLRDVMINGLPPDLTRVQWVGRLEYRDGAYQDVSFRGVVSLIRGTTLKDDNSPLDTRACGPPGAQIQATGPPVH